MPKEKKTEKLAEPNKQYFAFINSANKTIENAYDIVKYDFRNPERTALDRNTALDLIALALAYDEASRTYGYNPAYSNADYMTLKENAEKNKGKMRKSPYFQERIETMTMDQLRNLIYKDPGKEYDPKKEYDRRVLRMDEEYEDIFYE